MPFHLYLFGDALCLEVLGVVVVEAAGVDAGHLFYQEAGKHHARLTRPDHRCVQSERIEIGCYLCAYSVNVSE